MLVKYIFHENIFTDLFCLVFFCLVLNKTTAATSRVLPLFKQCLFHSPPSARPHVLRPCVCQPRGCHCNWLEPLVLLRATPQLDGYPSPSFSATPPASRALWLDGYPSLVGSWTHLHAQWRVSVGHRHTRRASAGFARWVSIAERRTGLYSAWSCSYGPRSSSRGLCDLGPSPVPDSGRSPALHATS